MKEMTALMRTDLQWGDRVALLAYEMRMQPAALVEQDSFGVRHMFKHEWYIREFDLPAGITFVGRIHKHGHIVKLLKGSASLIMEDREQIFHAPSVIHTVAGFQTVCFTITDITAQSWHFNPDGCRDIDELEDEHFGSPIAMLERGKQLWSAQSQLQ